MINGIEEAAFKAGYTIIVCQSNETYRREVVYTRLLVSHRVAGLLVSLSKETLNFDHFKMLQRRELPMVFFDRVSDEIDVSKVVVDDYQGAFEVVSHLVRSGYRRIAHLAGPDNLSICRCRREGYQDALIQNGIPVEEALIVPVGLDNSDGVIGFRKLMALKRHPDAIFAVNDPVATGAFVAIKAQGLKIPQEMALAGFSNTHLTALLDPPLTTVEQPSFEIGKTAVELLMAQINGTESPFIPRFKKLATQLVVRGST